MCCRVATEPALAAIHTTAARTTGAAGRATGPRVLGRTAGTARTADAATGRGSLTSGSALNCSCSVTDALAAPATLATGSRSGAGLIHLTAGTTGAADDARTTRPTGSAGDIAGPEVRRRAADAAITTQRRTCTTCTTGTTDGVPRADPLGRTATCPARSASTTDTGAADTTGTTGQQARAIASRQAASTTSTAGTGAARLATGTTSTTDPAAARTNPNAAHPTRTTCATVA